MIKKIGRLSFLTLIIAAFIYSGFVMVTTVPAYIWIVLVAAWIMYKEIK